MTRDSRLRARNENKIGGLGSFRIIGTGLRSILLSCLPHSAGIAAISERSSSIDSDLRTLQFSLKSVRRETPADFLVCARQEVKRELDNGCFPFERR